MLMTSQGLSISLMTNEGPTITFMINQGPTITLMINEGPTQGQNQCCVSNHREGHHPSIEEPVW